MDFLQQHAHRRHNPLTGEWVLVSPHRNQRPWQGKEEALALSTSRPHEPDCYLCPGNVRAGGAVNPQYEDVYIFENDYPAIRPDGRQESLNSEGLLRAEGVSGICRVICYHPDHSLSLATLAPAHIVRIVEAWQAEYLHLSSLPGIHHVQIFENRGEIMGCSNAHPHGQIWAGSFIPDIPAKESLHQGKWFAEKGSTLLSDYARLELASGERIVLQNDSFVAVVPFWAVWPYECMIIPLRPMQHIGQMTGPEKADFASILQSLTQKYDRLFQCPFPYSAGIHQSPCDGQAYPGWHWYMHFLPPLLRSASVKKFMVGYELLANPQRDFSEEVAAGVLRGV